MNKTIGILRKTNYQQHPETAPDLLVFGYQSKLYRDDAKALEFDREGHLIPAPFAPKELMISRLISQTSYQFPLIKLYCLCIVHWIVSKATW
jgi:hypothetical protein